MKITFLRNVFLLLLTLCAFVQVYAQPWSSSSVTSFIGPYPSRYGTVAFKVNDKVYMGFGQSGDTRIHKDIYEYNVVTGQWAYKTDFPGGNRYQPAVFVVGNKVYIGLGGANRNYASGKSDLWEYNTSTNTWIRKADFPGYRFGGATFVIDGKCYLVAGYGSPETDGNTSTGARRDCWQYDPQTNFWTKKANLPSLDPLYETQANASRRWDAAGFSYGGKGYVGGGYNYHYVDAAKTDFWQYDPVTNTWTNKGVWPTSSAGQGLVKAQTVEFCGKIYIGLGATMPNDFAISANPSFFIYDPLANSFSSMSSFPAGTNFFMGGVMFYHNGKIYAGNPALYTYNLHTISGPASTCSTASFSVSNVPSGTPVTWQASPSYLFTTSSGTGSTALVTSSGNTIGGEATIKFFVGSCAEPISRNFWVGPPTPSFTATYNSSHNWFTFTPVGNTVSASYDWVIDGQSYSGGSIIVNAPVCGGSPYITYYTFDVMLTVSNSCGTSTRCNTFKFTCVPSRTFSNLGICGGGGVGVESVTTIAEPEIYPNPTANFLIIGNDYPDYVRGLSAEKDRTISVKLYNNRQELVYQGSTMLKTMKVPVQKLPDGMYYLHLMNRDGVIQRQIQVKH